MEAALEFCRAAHPFRLILATLYIYFIYLFVLYKYLYMQIYTYRFIYIFRDTFIHSFIYPFIGLTGGMLRWQKLLSQVNLEAKKIILNFSLKGEEGENPISNKIGVVLDFHF